MTTDGTEKFKAIVMLANRVAWSFNEGVLNTCIPVRGRRRQQHD